MKWPNGIEYDGDWKAESAESAESGNVKSQKRGIEWRFCWLFRTAFEKERESSHGQMDPATKASEMKRGSSSLRL